jgi:hypothetical protein
MSNLYEVPAETLDELVAYLQQRPWVEANGLINLLTATANMIDTAPQRSLPGVDDGESK